MERWNHLRIPFADIKEATKNFENKIGEGGYGPVYEGKLFIKGEYYMKVAVKRLSEKSGQGLKEFWNEIDLLSDKKHENIITLVGYCNEGNEKIIVYEFAERGSLDFYLRYGKGNYVLTWVQRLKILVDAARGIDHLHNGLENNHVIIHRDIKSSNILIDDLWVAKISDFGLSRPILSGIDRSTVVTYACGTPGYVEPEVIENFMANKLLDLYSFGIVLFEVLCGRLCNLQYKDGIVFSAKVVKEYYVEDKLSDIIDPSIKEQMNPDALKRFTAIAYKCLQTREQRPLMDVVKKELEEILRIQDYELTSANSTMSRMEKGNPFSIPFEEIKAATKDFSTVIGKGGYGYIHVGILSIYGKYTKVAVKRSKEEFGQGRREFLTEIEMLSNQQHENVITLIGYCDEGNEKITVYEYAEHGSLDRYLTNSNTDNTLTWLERLKVVVDVARGLDHLHNHLHINVGIIHRDIKSSNILLNDKWVAKICDFGLSRYVFPGDAVSTNPCGTFPYVEPEYLQSSSLTIKSDVYSFGMVLFEVLCGRLSLIKDNDGVILSSKLAKDYYQSNKLDEIIDPKLREQMSPESLSKYSAIAYRCLRARDHRPLIDVVKKELEETLSIEIIRRRKFITKHRYILKAKNLSSEFDLEDQKVQSLKDLDNKELEETLEIQMNKEETK